MKFLKIFGLVILCAFLALVLFIVYSDYVDEKKQEETEASERAHIEKVFIPIVNSYLAAIDSCNEDTAKQFHSTEINEKMGQSAATTSLTTFIIQSSCKELSLKVKDIGKYRSFNDDSSATVRIKMEVFLKSKNITIVGEIYDRWAFAEEQGQWKIDSFTGIEFPARILEKKLGISYESQE
jgi:hypothetical protein